MGPISEERMDAAYQRILDEMNSPKPAKHGGPKTPRQYQPQSVAAGGASNVRTEFKANWLRDGPKEITHDRVNCLPDHEPDGQQPADDGWYITSFARAVFVIIWNVMYYVFIKPLCKIIKLVCVVLVIMAFFALVVVCAVNISLGGLEALRVWACDRILPNVLFGSTCINITPPATTKSTSPLTPLTPAELLLVRSPDRQFCLFGFGDLLGSMAEEQQGYMTDKQRKAFAVMCKAGPVAGRLQDIGSKQTRSAQRAQTRMIGLVNDLATQLPEFIPPPPLRFSAGWIWNLLIEPKQLPHPPSETLQELAREASNVLNGEVTGRKEFVEEMKSLHKEISQILSGFCSWNNLLGDGILDMTERFRDMEHKASISSADARATPWWQLKGVPLIGRSPLKAKTVGDVQSWMDQAKVIRNELVMWRRRKAKANVVCNVLVEGASKTAKLLKAMEQEEAHLGEMAQAAAELVTEVSTLGRHANSEVLQRWSKMARDLSVSYLQSFQQHYPKC
ncbi:uncharacterized protein CTRU02_215801 [Colletotrichum truncatum]|uniref:Uncharacterized protein n=1 Tax=Colletotrichum truncatum TaxID=5467 RepID=A0ACC3YBP1_COLTU|nr:uncharacterized protein CTRU02_15078 [Colletotrichum truncatum]KAF6781438.1 hypothetical protein CTRU02_15078 [Colletotrichum truncatum]